MLTEAQQELHDAYKLLSAEELRGMLGDDEDTDAAINAILGNGRAVEVKGGTREIDEDGDGNERTHHSIGASDDDGEDDEEAGEGDEGASAPAGAEQSDAEAAAAEVAEAPAAEAAPAVDAGELGDAHSDALAPLDLGVVDARYRTALDALKEEKASKLQQMLDGEIEPAEYSKYESEYEDKRDALKEQRAGEAEWLGQVHAFKAEALKDTGINYDTDTEKSVAFDDWLKRLAANPANEHRDEAWFLAHAHKKVMAEFDIAPKAEAKQEAGALAKAAPAKPAAPAPRKPNLAAVPPTLGGLPVAAPNDAGDAGEFSHLDNLSGMAYEKAIAKLTPEQRDRYATGE